MLSRFRAMALVLSLAAATTTAFAQSHAATGSQGASGSQGSSGSQGATGDSDAQLSAKIKWVRGPITAQIGDYAEIKVPAGYEFTDGAGARLYLELTGNPPDDNDVGILQPIADDKDNQWWVLFQFDESGYVKDDEKDMIDARAILDNIKKGTEEENEERKRRGWIPFHIDNWYTQPFYDQSTHNLTWATLGHDDRKDDAQTINYETRYLGRRGVMHVDLITDPATVNGTLPHFKTVMSGYAFTSGSRYADFVKGDKVAEYGLTALIAGGATAVALKTGLFAKLLALLAAGWKAIAVAFAALMTRIKNIWTGIKRKLSRDRQAPPGDDLAPR